jgi:hypothetical protein
VTLFEYMSVAFSIVLSLGAASILQSVRRVFAPDRRYWVHGTWVLIILFTYAVSWWSLWSFNRVESWTFLTFLLVLVQPGLLYLKASLLVGDEPATTASWHGHFFRVRRWFFSVHAFYMAAVITGSWLILEIPLLHPSRLFGAFHTVASIVGISTANERTHGVLVVLSALATLGAALVIFLEPTRWGAA